MYVEGVHLEFAGLGDVRCQPPARDRLAVLREPREGDWQAYVDPGSIDPKGYAQLVACLEMGSREAAPAQAVLPTIATFRYASLEQLRRRYQCGKNARLEVREDGLVYLHADAFLLVGAIVDAGTWTALKTEQSVRRRVYRGLVS